MVGAWAGGGVQAAGDGRAAATPRLPRVGGGACAHPNTLPDRCWGTTGARERCRGAAQPSALAKLTDRRWAAWRACHQRGRAASRCWGRATGARGSQARPGRGLLADSGSARGTCCWLLLHCQADAMSHSSCRDKLFFTAAAAIARCAAPPARPLRGERVYRPPRVAGGEGQRGGKGSARASKGEQRKERQRQRRVEGECGRGNGSWRGGENARTANSRGYR